MAKIVAVIGTRPEAIKMAPVVLALQDDPSNHDVRVCSTGQHREVLSDVMEFFSMLPDRDLRVMKRGQSLTTLTSTLLSRFSSYLAETKPDLVLVHGDTTSSFVSAMCSFYAGIPVGHVEAGLRTGDHKQPFPEEFNRKSISALTDLHFAPTRLAHENLIREGHNPDLVHLVGNTIVDSVNIVRRVLEKEPVSESAEELSSPWLSRSGLSSIGDYVLVTVHRRENHGEPLRRVMRSLRKLASAESTLSIAFVVHPNPELIQVVERELGGISNIHLLSPLGYLDFSRLLMFARLVITDSGGVQEECASFGRQVLVVREKSERPEGLDLGIARLVGTDETLIFNEAQAILHRPPAKFQGESPYGDGNAAARIVEIVGSAQ